MYEVLRAVPGAWQAFMSSLNFLTMGEETMAKYSLCAWYIPEERLGKLGYMKETL